MMVKFAYMLFGLLIGMAYYHGHPIWGNLILVAWIIFFAIDGFFENKKGTNGGGR